MKKILVPALLVAAGVVLYEQSKAQPNLYISTGSIVIFMFLLFKLNTQIPHKNDNFKDTDDVQ